MSQNMNLAVIPNNWGLTFGSGPQIIHVDNTVLHNGHPSIRIDGHTSADQNPYRECDGPWLKVKPGDHVVLKAWVITAPSGLNPDPSQTAGGRIGMDYYAQTSAGYGILFKTSSPDSDAGVPGWYGNAPGAIGGWWVPYGKDWTQIGWDVIIPSDFYPYVNHNGMKTCTPVQIDSLVPILDAQSGSNPASVWFADAELYINPVTAPPVGTLEVHAFSAGQEVNAPVAIGTQTQTTPITINVVAGTVTLTCAYQGASLSQTVTVSVGQTTQVTFNFTQVVTAGPSGTNAIVAGIVILASIGFVAMVAASRRR